MLVLLREPFICRRHVWFRKKADVGQATTFKAINPE
jgi:hypothetical protein